MISLGCVLVDAPGLLYLDHLYHLYGENDWVHRLGNILSVGRGPLMFHSSWKQALAAGKIIICPIGPMSHRGKDGYYSRAKRLPNGQQYLDKTAEAIVHIIQ